MYIITTTIPANEIRDFEFFMYDYGIEDFTIYVNHTTLFLTIGFVTKEEAVLFRLREFDVFYMTHKPFYFEPDTDFEIELEQTYGIYSDADDHYIRMTE